MSTPFVGEVRPFAGNFAIREWSYCDGSLISIAQNTALFSLLGTFYGGNGTTTFALPDLRGRVPVGMGTSIQGNSYFIGEVGGTESVTLNGNQIPVHNHGVAVTTVAASSVSPNSNFPAQPAREIYGTTDASVLGSNLGPSGSNLPHENRQPLLVVNFIISMFGVYPSRS